VWLAFAVTFTDINTVLPGLIVQAGGTEIHVGILTGVMIGVPLVTQLLFAGFLSSRGRRKPYLLLGLNLRIAALVGVAWTLAAATGLTTRGTIGIVYLWMMLFGLSGAFAGVAYNDILGKSIAGDLRKRFFVTRQIASTAAILVSALVARWVLSVYEYPTTYRILFWGAGATLLIASAGFWGLREERVAAPPKGGILTLTRSLPGMLLSNIVWTRIVRLGFYRGVLLAATALGVVLPFLALILANTGSTGTLNLTIAVFPLVVGLLLRAVGYWPVFSLAAIAMAISGVFAYRLNCHPDILTAS